MQIKIISANQVAIDVLSKSMKGKTIDPQKGKAKHVQYELSK